MNITEKRKEVFDWAKYNLIGKILLLPTIRKIAYFTTRGVKHAISRGYGNPEIEFELMKQIYSGLAFAHYSGFRKNEQIKDTSLGVHQFFNTATIDGEHYLYWILVKEYNNNKLEFYDLGLVKNK